jgi:uncharacterized protein (UPF0332 family)
MTIEDCFDRGLLRKGNVNIEETEHQLQIAKDYIKKAEKIFDAEVFDVCFLTTYISIFHSARALLYSKGYKERSHYCLFEYIKDEFILDNDIKRLAVTGQNYRETRRMIQYDGSLCSQDSAKEAIIDAKKFLKAAEKYMPKQKKLSD